MGRPPDSRASLGQRLEDEDDAITEGVRLQTKEWVAKLRRGNPRSDRHHTSILAGIAGGLMDELWELAQGDIEKAQALYASFAAAYFDRADEDRAADAQEVSRAE